MRWVWGIIAPAVALAWWSLGGRRARARYYAGQLAERGGALPPATVIVPVKGDDEGLKENLAALASLDYPDYELTVAARAASDIPAGVLPERARVVIAGAGQADTVEKISNLLAGVAAARAESEVLAFADSDGRAGRGWLAALVRALGAPRAGAATGYRWYVPTPPDLASLLRSVWNAAVAGRFGPGPAEFAWGGAMAIRREQFHRFGVPERWRGALTDDYTLADAVSAAGFAVIYAPGALVACPDHTSARAFFRWARRQMILTRIYRPRLWWLALLSSVLYCSATAVAAARRSGLALALLVIPAVLKGRERAALARTALPGYSGWFRRCGWVHACFAPLNSWVWLAVCLSSARAQAIEWRGRRYPVKRSLTPSWTQGCADPR